MNNVKRCGLIEGCCTQLSRVYPLPWKPWRFQLDPSAILGRPNQCCVPFIIIPLQSVTIILMYSIAHSLPHRPDRLHRNAHILLPRPHPRYPASDLTTTSLNSHVICTDPQLLIEERLEAYKSIQAAVDHVEEKRLAEGVCVLRRFVTYKAGDPTRS